MDETRSGKGIIIIIEHHMYIPVEDYSLVAESLSVSFWSEITTPSITIKGFIGIIGYVHCI